MFGTAIHETLQTYLQVMYNSTLKLANSYDIRQFFKQRMLLNYKKTRLLLDKLFTTSLVIASYFKTGMQIILYFKSHRLKYFKARECELIGILLLLKYLIRPGIFFKGFIDIVIKLKLTGKIKIIDFKTSQRGWNDNQKKDEMKKSQLLLYKLFYSKQFNVDINLITVLFIILKKLVIKFLKFNTPRIQVFLPSNKGPSIKKAENILLGFLNNCVDSNGSYIINENNYTPAADSSACRFCPYYYLNTTTKKTQVCSKWKKKYKEVINE